MSFHLQRLAEFLNRPAPADAATLLGTAAPYAVRLQQNAPSKEAVAWRVIGVHHLNPDENRGRHAVYVDVVDEAGNRVRDPNLCLRWGWEGQRKEEHADPKAFDKPDNEPAAHVDLYSGQLLWLQLAGDGLVSDQVLNCHTNHPDERGPNGQIWNSIGHHSFYVLFQRCRQAVTEPTPDGEAPPTEELVPATQDYAIYLQELVADGTHFLPGTPIQQQWTVRNSGTTTWGAGYTLALQSGDGLGAPVTIAVPTTPPGAEATLALTGTAPTTPGTYRGVWQLRTAAGTWFGDRLWLDIVVAPAIDPPIDPPVVGEPSEGQGNKLGFYMHLSTDQHGLWDAVSRVQPPVLLIHADTANTMLLEQIRQFRAPDTFVIGRLYKDVNTQRQLLANGDPAAHGRAMAEEILHYNFGLATKRGANGRLLIDAWISLNEAVPGPTSDQFRQAPEETAQLLRNYDRFQVAFRERLQAAGVEAVAFNFGAGNFGTAAHYLEYFSQTLASYLYLGFHEYGWPTLYPTAGTATSGGTYRDCMAGIRARYGDRHRVIMTEAGLARMYQNPAGGDVGWLNRDTPLTEEHYWASLAWYNRQMTADSYVLGACLFEVGHHGQWESFRHIGTDHNGQPLGLIDRIVSLKESATPRARAMPQGAPQPAARLPLPLPQPIAPGQSLAEVDPALYAAWRKHMEQGFANNQLMFNNVLNAFMNPYWTTVWMYRVLFGLGIASFLAAVGISIWTGQQGFGIIFGTLSAVAFLSYFWNRPLQALEENLQFITWLGIIYNSYWTRLAYIQKLDSVQQELEAATNDTVAKITMLMDKHSERSGKRPTISPSADS